MKLLIESLPILASLQNTEEVFLLRYLSFLSSSINIPLVANTTMRQSVLCKTYFQLDLLVLIPRLTLMIPSGKTVLALRTFVVIMES